MNQRFEPTDQEWERLAPLLADRRDLGPHRSRPAHPGGRVQGGAGLGRPDRQQRHPGPPARRGRPPKGLGSIQASRQQALGRSRGGLTTKLHAICEGRGPNYHNRNQVERLMNRRKQFRAVAIRFDRLAVRYQATVCVADLFIWLRARPTNPAAIRGTRPRRLGRRWMRRVWRNR